MAQFSAVRSMALAPAEDSAPRVMHKKISHPVHQRLVCRWLIPSKIADALKAAGGQCKRRQKRSRKQSAATPEERGGHDAQKTQSGGGLGDDETSAVHEVTGEDFHRVDDNTGENGRSPDWVARVSRK